MGGTPVSITIVGGYLGAGKTTLLNHLLRNTDDRRLGVIVNDFGSINIDAELVVGVDGDLVQLSNGCVCCTIRDDLVEALRRVLDRPDPPEHVIVEASGISDPRRIAATVETQTSREWAAIDAVVVVVDVEHYLDLGRRDRIVAGGQIGAADILVLNKVDLVEETALEALEQRFQKKLKRGRVLRTTYGQVAPALVLGVHAFDPASLAAGYEPEVHVHSIDGGAELHLGHDHAEHDHHDHDHDGHDHDDHDHADHDHGHGHDHAHGSGRIHDFWTWSFRTERPLSARRLKRAINELPDRVMRAKGVVHLASHPKERAVMHVVGRRAELCLGDPWGEHPAATGLVVIGDGAPVASARLEALFRGCEVEPGETGPAKAVMRWVRRVLPA